MVPFGPYELLTTLGQGAFAIVFRARETATGELVAIKAMRPNMIRPETLDLFQNEGLLGNILRHPNIVAVKGVEVIGAQGCLIMEYVDGWTLQDLLYKEYPTPRWSELPKAVTLDILIGIADALAFAHAARAPDGHRLLLIHRDLKPLNVLMSRDGSVKVMDFGIAKFRSDLRHGAPTQHGIVRGTPGYLSPEQARGMEIDARADIWAFGCILYELVCMRRMFAGSTPREVMMQIVLDPLTARITHVEERFLELADIYAGCCTKDPDNRYQNMRMVHERLVALRQSDTFRNKAGLDRWLRYSHYSLPAPVPDGTWIGNRPPPAITSPHDHRSSVFVRAIRRS